MNSYPEYQQFAGQGKHFVLPPSGNWKKAGLTLEARNLAVDLLVADRAESSPSKTRTGIVGQASACLL